MYLSLCNVYSLHNYLSWSSALSPSNNLSCLIQVSWRKQPGEIVSHCKLHLNSDRVSQSMWYTGRSCELLSFHIHTHTATHIFSLGPLPVYQIFCVTMDRTEKVANIWPRGCVTWLSSTSLQMKKRIYSWLMFKLSYQPVIPLEFSFISFSEPITVF